MSQQVSPNNLCSKLKAGTAQSSVPKASLGSLSSLLFKTQSTTVPFKKVLVKALTNAVSLTLKQKTQAALRQKGQSYSARLCMLGLLAGMTAMAQASGDYNCGDNFTLNNQSYNECGVSTPALDPGNDSQVNLLLMLADKGLITFEPNNEGESSWSDYGDFPFNRRDIKAAGKNVYPDNRQEMVESRYAIYMFNEHCQTYVQGILDLLNQIDTDEDLTANERTYLKDYLRALRTSDSQNECAEDFTSQLHTQSAQNNEADKKIAAFFSVADAANKDTESGLDDNTDTAVSVDDTDDEVGAAIESAGDSTDSLDIGYEDDSAATTTQFEIPELSEPLSPQAQAYLDYILASDYFYQEDMAAADALYQALSQLPTESNASDGSTETFSPWLVETATYMRIRTAVNQAYHSARVKYGWIERDSINPYYLSKLNQAIIRYFKNYPTGRYSASARGFLRRSFWFAKQTNYLVKEISWQINHPQSPHYNLDATLIPEEIDRRILTMEYLSEDSLSDPMLLAVYDLMRMRDEGFYATPEEGEENRYIRQLTLLELQNQKARFANHPQLYNFLLASFYFYVEQNPSAALEFLPTQPVSEVVENSDDKKLSYEVFSRYALKAKVLTAMGEESQAQTVWRALNAVANEPYQNRITELAIAINAEQSNTLAKELLGDEPTITSPRLQKQLIKFSADEALIEQLITNSALDMQMKETAKFMLLYRTLLNGQYEDYLRYESKYLPDNAVDYIGYDYDNSESETSNLPPFAAFTWKGKTISKTIKCGSINSVVEKLKTNPDDRLQKLCLSEFWYDIRGEYYLPYWLEVNDWYYRPVSTEQHGGQTDNPLGAAYHYLGDVPSPFAGQELHRQDLYQQVFQGGKKDELSAYALHRAIGCYASSGSNHCGGEAATERERKQWFQTLKRDYAAYDWSKNQKYYW